MISEFMGQPVILMMFFDNELLWDLLRPKDFWAAPETRSWSPFHQFSLRRRDFGTRNWAGNRRRPQVYMSIGRWRH